MHSKISLLLIQILAFFPPIPHLQLLTVLLPVLGTAILSLMHLLISGFHYFSLFLHYFSCEAFLLVPFIPLHPSPLASKPWILEPCWKPKKMTQFLDPITWESSKNHGLSFSTPAAICIQALFHPIKGRQHGLSWMD